MICQQSSAARSSGDPLALSMYPGIFGSWVRCESANQANGHGYLLVAIFVGLHTPKSRLGLMMRSGQGKVSYWSTRPQIPPYWASISSAACPLVEVDGGHPQFRVDKLQRILLRYAQTAAASGPVEYIKRKCAKTGTP